MDGNAGLKIGSGWRAPGGPIWLLEDVENGREAVLARWRAGAGGALERETLRVAVGFLSPEHGWVAVEQSAVDALVEQLMSTEAAERLHGVRERAKAQAIAEEGSAIDRQREAAREERLRASEQVTAVPASEKSLWPTGTKPEGEVWPPPPPVEVLVLSDSERQLGLAVELEDVAERMLYEARELRRLAGVNDDDGGGTDGGS
jgi:hypothetical protein